MDDDITKPLRRKHFLEMVRKWAIDGNTSPTALPPDDSGHSRVLPFDYEIALAEFDGDEEFLMEVIDEFFENATAQVITLKAAISQQDAETITREAHSIKGGATII